MRTWIASIGFTLVILGCGRVAPNAAPYELRDGMAMVEGDIIVGATPADVSARTALAVTAGMSWARWPKAHVPYAIDPKLPDPSRVLRAIDHFQQNSNLVFIPRTTQTSYVVFKPWAQGYCRSWIGRSGSAQAVELDSVCNTRSVIHELGHAVGLWHEHTRKDRGKYVAVHLENVMAGLQSNFALQLTYSQILGPYDFASVMHYRADELSANGKPTITRLDGSTDGLSNPDGLSAGDIAALRIMYPTRY